MLTDNSASYTKKYRKANTNLNNKKRTGCYIDSIDLSNFLFMKIMFKKKEYLNKTSKLQSAIQY